MAKEAEEAGEQAVDVFKQRVFASAFGSFNPKAALDEYYKTFEHSDEPDYEVDEFIPESEADVHEMINVARRAGVIK